MKAPKANVLEIHMKRQVRPRYKIFLKGTSIVLCLWPRKNNST